MEGAALQANLHLGRRSGQMGNWVTVAVLYEPVPEPGMWTLARLCLPGMAWLRRRTGAKFNK